MKTQHLQTAGFRKRAAGFIPAVLKAGFIPVMLKAGVFPTVLIVALAPIFIGPSATAQTGDDKAFEKSLDSGLRDVINLGATIFNTQEDHAGCYRLFEGSLRTTKPLLVKYPDLQKKIDVGLAQASQLPRMHDRAHSLRKVLDEIRATVYPQPKIVAVSLWDRLGGEKGVDKVLVDFMGAAAADPKVDFTRGGKFMFPPPQVDALKKSLLDFVSSATGGPYKYKGPSMKDVHKGMGITDEQFNALAGHLKTALEKNGVRAEDVNAVLGAVGGTRGDIVEMPAKKVVDVPPIKKNGEATLWDRLGGDKGVSLVINDFVIAAASDPKVDFTRAGKYTFTPQQVDALKKSLLDFVSSVAGGPHKYNGPTMKEAHKSMGITDDQFNAIAGHLKDALEKNGVKAEDVKAVLGAVGGTRSDIVEPAAKKIDDMKDNGPKKVPQIDPNMARIKGTVTIAGQKLNHGFVTFVNVAGQRYSANVKKDGSYVFRNGFPPGEYTVLLEDSTTPAAQGEIRVAIPLQYTAPVVSPLRFTASKGENAYDIAVK